jgi:probable HAF family extracellular repeat protein
MDRCSKIGASVLALAIVFVSRAIAADTYTFVTFEVPGTSQATVPRGINNTGQIVGYFFTGTTPHGFRRNPDGSFITLNVPGASTTQPEGINDSGQIVGSYEDIEGGLHAFIWSPGTSENPNGSFRTIDITGSLFTVATGINNAGQVIGQYGDSSGVISPFIRAPDGTFIRLPPTVGQPTGINNKGQVVGYVLVTAGDRRVSVWDSFTNTSTRLFDLDSAIPGGINDAGQIVVTAGSSTGSSAFRRDPDGTIIEIRPPTATANSGGQGINNRADIVGGFFPGHGYWATLGVEVPRLDQLSPIFGPIGIPITIFGAGFGTSQGTSIVRFSNTPATVTSWSDTAISVIVPTADPVTQPAPGLYPVTVTTAAATSNILYFDPRTTQEFLRLAVVRARSFLPDDVTPAKLAREAYRVAILLREWCKNLDDQRLRNCSLNENSRDAEYFLRGYAGAVLSPTEIDFSDVGNEFFNSLGPAASIFYDLGKLITLPITLPLPTPPGEPLPVSPPGGFAANAEGYFDGLMGIPIDTAIELYGSPRPPQLTPDSSPLNPLLPDNSITFPLSDEGAAADINTFAVPVNPTVTYFFDPAPADVYLFGLANGNRFRSVVVPLEIGLTARGYVIQVGDRRFNVNIGEVFDFVQHGFVNGVDGFAILDFDVPLTRELVTGLTFTESSNLLLTEVLLHFDATSPLDKTPPTISTIANPRTLWPPNNKMIPVAISGTITDAGSAVNTSTAAYAVIDEYGLIQPAGKVALRLDGSYFFTIQLQASRNEKDNDGRKYSILISAQDNAGNRGSRVTVVTVPHDQRN